MSSEIYELPGLPPVTLDDISTDFDSYRGTATPIVIDHGTDFFLLSFLSFALSKELNFPLSLSPFFLSSAGSWRTRAGWANEENPRCTPNLKYPFVEKQMALL